MHLLHLLASLKMQQIYLLKSCCCFEKAHSIACMTMPHEINGCSLAAFHVGHSYKPKHASLMAA